MRFCLLGLCAAWTISCGLSWPTEGTPTEGPPENGTASTLFTIIADVGTKRDFETDETVSTSVTASSVSSTRNPKTDSPLLYHYSLQQQTEVQNIQCGRRTTRNARIVGGSDSYFGEFPWAVSVRLLTTHYCGGTIINRYWVLTAAHCVKRYTARYFRVRPGGRDVDLDESRPGWDIHVDEIAVHPNFGQPRRYSNDLALLKLKRPIRYSDQAQPICLPRSFDETYDGLNATVVGWGFQKEGEETKSKKLQKVEVPILNNSICAKWYSEAYNGYVQIHDYQICAGYKEGGKDACKGDSGGPLVMKDGDRFTLIGVVSAGVGCGRQHLPGIYSRVAVYVPWINRVTGGLNGP